MVYKLSCHRIQYQKKKKNQLFLQLALLLYMLHNWIFQWHSVNSALVDLVLWTFVWA